MNENAFIVKKIVRKYKGGHIMFEKEKEEIMERINARHSDMKAAMAKAAASDEEPVEGNFKKELGKISHDLDDLLS